MDDIGIAANKATDHTRNTRAVFQCIRNAGLKLTIEKCRFGVRQFELLGRTISSKGVSSHLKIQNFLSKFRCPKSKKSFPAISGVREILQKLHSQDGQKAQPILKTVKSRSLNQHSINY